MAQLNRAAVVAWVAVVKRTGEVWDLVQGYQADTASNARTEPGFHAQLAMIAPPSSRSRGSHAEERRS